MTIAKQLNATEFPFRLYDAKGNQIYLEDSDGFWIKCKYDAKGKVIYLEDSDGYWAKREYDAKGNEIYYETSTGLRRQSQIIT